jgi:hypothetical protein
MHYTINLLEACLKYIIIFIFYLLALFYYFPPSFSVSFFRLRYLFLCFISIRLSFSPTTSFISLILCFPSAFFFLCFLFLLMFPSFTSFSLSFLPFVFLLLSSFFLSLSSVLTFCHIPSPAVNYFLSQYLTTYEHM